MSRSPAGPRLRRYTSGRRADNRNLEPQTRDISSNPVSTSPLNGGRRNSHTAQSGRASMAPDDPWAPTACSRPRPRNASADGSQGLIVGSARSSSRCCVSAWETESRGRAAGINVEPLGVDLEAGGCGNDDGPGAAVAPAGTPQGYGGWCGFIYRAEGGGTFCRLGFSRRCCNIVPWISTKT